MKSSDKPRRMLHPIIGQEAVCPDGLGRVIAFEDRFPEQWIQVQTYVNDRSCQWDPENVELVAIVAMAPALQDDSI